MSRSIRVEKAIFPTVGGAIEKVFRRLDLENEFNFFVTADNFQANAACSLMPSASKPDIIITKCTSHAGTSGNHAGWKVTNSSNGTDVQWKGEEYGSQSWEHAWATDTEIITAFGSDGFTVGTDVEVNQSGRSYVAYCWKVNGGTTSTIAAGSTTYDPSETVVQVNSTSKVSIMQYQGSTSYGSISHGLGAKPHCFWAKSKNHSSNAPPVMWGDSGDAFSNYNQWSGGANYTGIMDAEPDTSRIHLIDNNLVFRPQGANSYTAMAWVEVQGFSKFSQYEGNGSDDGPFVYTGFKQALVFIKNKERVCDCCLLYTSDAADE